MNNADIRVMLVDDDEMIRDCITAYLEDEGFYVHAVANAEEALESMVSLCPSVCISDMRLPGMNGDEFILKAHALSPGTGYLLHTGMMYLLSDELCAIGMTADDVLQKPVHDLSLLVRRIKEIIISEGMV